MAKRTPNSSRPVDPARTTTITAKPPAAPVAAAAAESALPPAPVAAPQPVMALPPALVSLPATTDTGAKSPPQRTGLAGGTLDLEDTMGQVSRLYRAITGRDVPVSDAPYALIPAEKDPVQHVEEQLGRLLDVLASTEVELGGY